MCRHTRRMPDTEVGKVKGLSNGERFKPDLHLDILRSLAVRWWTSTKGWLTLESVVQFSGLLHNLCSLHLRCEPYQLLHTMHCWLSLGLVTGARVSDYSTEGSDKAPNRR